ncbi:MAG TPA: aminotransferase class V-fold PLP-dependent enzyme, partial [Thermoanaerobaculia bacterium]|nr:aminotransferase class V-fold PLP-dependent enzyme [Thermoanaerobaculia bacterium]
MTDLRPRADLFCLDPSVVYTNHGSYGACPSAVLFHQSALRLRIEREPVDFFSRDLPALLRAARESLGHFVGADPDDLAFVPNVTTGVNTVLGGWSFAPGDEILTTDHAYAACRKALDHVARRAGARVVVAHVPFPFSGEDELVDAVIAGRTARTRLALLDHVSSPTAVVFPIARLVRELEDLGVETLVDGAHALGMVPLDLEAIGAAFYTANAHKWLCAPKGSAFLHVRRDRQANLHPRAISHGYGAGFRAEFDWTGTNDPTPYLSMPECLRVLGDLFPGGWTDLMERNHLLAVRAREIVCDALNLPPPCPEEFIGSMASIPLPAPAK